MVKFVLKCIKVNVYKKKREGWKALLIHWLFENNVRKFIIKPLYKVITISNKICMMYAGNISDSLKIFTNI